MKGRNGKAPTNSCVAKAKAIEKRRGCSLLCEQKRGKH